MKQLCYRAADDAFVIKDGDAVLGEANASDLAGARVLDPDAAKVGLRRLLGFREWQAKIAGTVLWQGNAEDAMARAPRL